MRESFSEELTLVAVFLSKTRNIAYEKSRFTSVWRQHIHLWKPKNPPKGHYAILPKLNAEDRNDFSDRKAA